MPPRAKKEHFKQRIDYGKEVLAIVFLGLGIFVALSLASYSPEDPALNSASNMENVGNLGGIIGAYLADILFTVFGVSAYVTAFVFLVMAALQFLGKRLRLRVREVLFYLGLIICASTLVHLKFERVVIAGHAVAGGGIIGGLAGQILIRYAGHIGAIVVAASGTLLFFTLATHVTLGSALRLFKRSFVWWIKRVSEGIAIIIFGAWRALRQKMPAAFRYVIGSAKKLTTREKSCKQTPAISNDWKPEPVRTSGEDAQALKALRTAVQKPDNGGPKILQRANIKKTKKGDAQLKFLSINCEGYTLPPLSLLDTGNQVRAEVDEESLRKNSILLEHKLKDFAVEGRVTAIHPGPVITRYEFEPSPGTKISKIANLEDDLSMLLGGRSVRILPHLPGKAAIGIEVPNGDRETVWLKDIISSNAFQKATSKLSLALGVNTEGNPMVTDLAKMPHMLVAGATGSGKSVGINSMIVSLLYKLSPQDVRLILVDPKMLELSIYEGIPHLLLPVVTKPKKAVMAMRWAVKEMERRYRLMASVGARDLIGYNEKIKQGTVETIAEEEAEKRLAEDKEAVCHTGHLPYIIIIIDELADLMMTASQDMEETITRLAQMARAAGIHLVLATQRPSVDVITGLIKANFPSRIAYKVTARHDSRTILDSIGAEQLLGHGDMLFMTPSGGNLIRVHGPLVTVEEIGRVVEHIKQQGDPVYNESILSAEEENANGLPGFEEEDDDMYDIAVKLVSETRQASISMVQRRLRIGYNRAARLIERMEAEGVVGRASGSKPREVLIGNIQR